MKRQLKQLIIDTSVFEDAARFDAAFETLPAFRQEKILKLRFPKDRRLSLGAGVLLEKAIKDAGLAAEPFHVSGADSAAVKTSAVEDPGENPKVDPESGNPAAPCPKILEGPQGKPYLEGLEDCFQFSLSHSGTFAYCVYAVDPAGHAPSVGCDIEKIGKADFGIADRFFSPEEWSFLNTLEGEEKNTAFYRLWTLKESILKADGRGGQIPFDSFTVRLLAEKAPETDFETPGPGNAGRVRTVSLYEDQIPGYRLAWCTIESD